MVPEGRLQKAIEQRDSARRRAEKAERLYNDLLMQVANKIPGETRHETARRIIDQHENQTNAPEGAAIKGESNG